MNNRLALLLISPIAHLAGRRLPPLLARIVAPGAARRCWAPYGFCEGPAADAEERLLLRRQDDTIHLWRPGRPVEVFVDDSLDASGMMFNARGGAVVCEGAAVTSSPST